MYFTYKRIFGEKHQTKSSVMMASVLRNTFCKYPNQNSCKISCEEKQTNLSELEPKRDFFYFNFSSQNFSELMRKERSCALPTQSKRLPIRITRAQTSQVTDPRIRRCYFSPSPLTYTLRVYLTSYPSALSCCIKPSKAQKWKRAEEQTQSKALSALQED